MFRPPINLVFMAFLCACVGPAPIPLPAGGPETLPPEVQKKAGRAVTLESPEETGALQATAGFYALSQQMREELWPGWRVDHLAVALLLPGGRWLVTNHANPGSAMRVVDQILLPCPVFIGPASLENLPVGGVADFNGYPTVVARFEELAREGEMQDLVLLLFHLSTRHVFSDLCGLEPVPPQSLIRGNPVEGGIQGQAEIRALINAWQSMDEQDRLAGVAAFLRARAARREGLTSDSIDRERVLETQEGLIFYLELQVMLRAAEKPGWDFARTGEVAAARCREVTEEIIQTGLGSDWFSYCVTGMIQARLLDRLSPEWKHTFTTARGLALEDLLAAALALPRR